MGRVRFVLIGLVLGVLVAVIVASQGCSGRHHLRRFHGSGGPSPPVAVASAPTASAPTATAHPHRAADPNGPFFSYRHGHMTRVDAPRGRREVALTFDDGPGPQTMQLLGELRRLHARATFFVVGSMAALRPDVVRAEHRARMEVENHTWSHAALPSLGVHGQRVEIERANLIIRRLTGIRPRFMRPPNLRAGARTARILRLEHMVGVFRTIDTRDWTLPGVRAIVRSALHVTPGGVVEMHDAGGYTRSQTLAAVPHIVRGLRRRHLRLVTVGSLFDGR